MVADQGFQFGVRRPSWLRSTGPSSAILTEGLLETYGFVLTRLGYRAMAVNSSAMSYVITTEKGSWAA